jgi:hypothetical protein
MKRADRVDVVEGCCWDDIFRGGGGGGGDVVVLV